MCSADSVTIESLTITRSRAPDGGSWPLRRQFGESAPDRVVADGAGSSARDIQVRRMADLPTSRATTALRARRSPAAAATAVTG